MFSISPLTGNILDTVFTVSPSSVSFDYQINWGDGLISTDNDASHIYTLPGIYTVSVLNCDTLSAFTVSAFSPYFADEIMVEADVLSAYTSCHNLFTLNLSAKNESTRVSLYTRDSSSAPASTNTSFWKHLQPEWSFYNTDLEEINYIDIVGDPVYSGTNVLGYTAVSSVYFKDDMPGNQTLFFTIQEKDRGVLINSRSYAALDYSVSAVVPTNLLITLDGLNPISGIQWSDHNIPIFTTVNNNTSGCSTIIHYASGYLIDSNLTGGCYGITSSAYHIPLAGEVLPIDCISTDSIVYNTLFVPSSAIQDEVQVFSPIACGESQYEQYVDNYRRSPYQVVLTATGVFDIGGEVYTLTGQSEPFDIFKFEKFYDFYRHGEDKNIYDLIKQYSHVVLDELPMFDSYLSAIAGEGDTLGKVYDKIVNFRKDHSDIDVCQIDSIYDIAEMLDADIVDFGLEFPEELRRLMNLVTVPLHKLIGTRIYNGSIGEIIATDDLVTTGEIVAYKRAGDERYDYFEIPETTNMFSVTAFPFYDNYMDYCFYRWNVDTNPIVQDSIINYNDDRNRLNRNIISSDAWYNDDGIIVESIDYILTRNLLNN